VFASKIGIRLLNPGGRVPAIRWSRRVPAIRGIGYSQKHRSSVARFVSFRRRFGEGAPSGVVVRLAELRLDARANIWIMMK